MQPVPPFTSQMRKQSPTKMAYIFIHDHRQLWKWDLCLILLRFSPSSIMRVGGEIIVSLEKGGIFRSFFYQNQHTKEDFTENGCLSLPSGDGLLLWNPEFDAWSAWKDVFGGLWFSLSLCKKPSVMVWRSYSQVKSLGLCLEAQTLLPVLWSWVEPGPVACASPAHGPELH